MPIFPTLMALCLSAHYYATILAVAQENRTTTTIATTLVIPVYTFAHDSHSISSSPSTTATLPERNTTFLTLAAPSPTTTRTTTIGRNIQSNIPTQHLPSNSPAHSTATISSSPSPSTILLPSPPRETTNPEWLLPVSISLLCYDFLAATAFIWCWVMGYFWWWTSRTRQSGDVRVLREGRESSVLGVLVNESLEWEMRRLGMV